MLFDYSISSCRNNILIMMIIGSIFRCAFSQATALSRFLQPVQLPLRDAPQIPTLQLKSQQYLLQNWWSESPFELPSASPMNVPVFSFLTGEYIRKQIQLPKDIFNYPLRRDLIYRLYNFRINLDKFNSKVTRNRAMTHGSRIKMRPQKGQGGARMGDKRAPHLFKGGKAHGSKAKVYSFPLNAKIKINALKALLSAKLAQGKIKIIDSEAIAEGKTKHVAKAFEAHIKDERGILCVITGQDCNQNFQLAQKNHPKIVWHDTYSLDVFSLFKADKILITQKGLEELIQNLYKTIYVVYRQPYMPKIEELQEPKSATQTTKIDPSTPYDFKFKILAQYMELYKKIKTEKPHLLELELARVRKV